MPEKDRMKKNFPPGIFSRAKCILASLLMLILLTGMSLLWSCSVEIPVTLYFAKQSGDHIYLAAEVRNIPEPDDLYKSVIEELVKGPDKTGLLPTLPSNTRVKTVEISGETAVVDFSREILTSFEEIPHSSTTETLAIYSIVNTLTEIEEIKRVKITIEGMESGEIEGLYVEDFWGHIGIHEEFTRNEEIIGQ